MNGADFSEHKEFLAPEELSKALFKLEGKTSKARANAARRLGSTLNPESIPALQNAVKDASPDVWSAALRSLAEVGSKASIDALISALDDLRAPVRAEAARRLGMSRVLRASQKLKSIVKAERDIPARQEMVEALGRIEDESALTVLASFLSDKEHAVRWSATWAIGHIGRTTKSSKAVEMLSLLEKHSDPRVRHEAGIALRMIKPQQV